MKSGQEFKQDRILCRGHEGGMLVLLTGLFSLLFVGASSGMALPTMGSSTIIDH